MMPLRDPLASLIHSAAERAVKDVYIDGIQTVKDHQCLTLDRERGLAKVAEAQPRMEAGVPDRDYRNRSSLEIFPLSLPMAGD